MAQFRNNYPGSAAVNDRHTREDAERALETALLVLEHKELSAEQLTELAEAVAAFNERAYPLAVVLAFSAMRQQGELRLKRRPIDLTKTWNEIKAAFTAACQLGAPALMAVPIVNGALEIVGWTYNSPRLSKNKLVHPEAERLVGSGIVSRQVQLVKPDDIVQAGGPRGWIGPWRCYALCSAAIPPITSLDTFPIVASSDDAGAQAPIMGSIEPIRRKRGRRPVRQYRDQP